MSVDMAGSIPSGIEETRTCSNCWRQRGTESSKEGREDKDMHESGVV